MPKPGVFWVLTPPTFWRTQKMEVREGGQKKLGEGNLLGGGKKKF